MTDEVAESFGSLKRLSRVMAGLSFFGMIAEPFQVAAAYLLPGALMPGFFRLGIYPAHSSCGATLSGVDLPLRLAALVFALVSVGFLMWALWELRALFRRYGRGEVFSAAALGHLNRVGVALFASEVMDIALQPVISVLLGLKTLAGPHHELVFSFALSGDDAAMLFAAGVVLVIARVMVAARRLAEENAGFV